MRRWKAQPEDGLQDRGSSSRRSEDRGSSSRRSKDRGSRSRRSEDSGEYQGMPAQGIRGTKRARIDNSECNSAQVETRCNKVSTLYSNLPDDIVFKIQAQLPVVSFVRSRLVCKAWKAAVDSPRYLLEERMKCEGGEREHMLVVAGFRRPQSVSHSGPAKYLRACMYDPSCSRWYRLRICDKHGLAQGQEEKEEEEGEGEGEDDERASLIEFPRMSVPGGMLMARRCDVKPGDEDSGTLPQIGNPVTGSWARLPALPAPGLRVSHVRGVLVDAEAQRFKLVVVGDKGLFIEREVVMQAGQEPPVVPVSTYVFDSAVGRWDESSRVMPWDGDFNVRVKHGAFLNNVLYCLTIFSDLLAYDMEKATWSLVHLESSALHIRGPTRSGYSAFHLFTVRDRLLCTTRKMGYTRDVYWREVEKWEMWEVDWKARAWVVVASMPPHMSRELRAERHVESARLFTYSVVSGQQEVYILQTRRSSLKIMAVDFRKTPPTWSWLPAFPANTYTKSFCKGILQCFDPWLQLGSWIQPQV